MIRNNNHPFAFVFLHKNPKYTDGPPYIWTDISNNKN